MKKNYYYPKSEVIELSVKRIIAVSGDAGGSGSDMPWGTNEHELDYPWQEE